MLHMFDAAFYAIVVPAVHYDPGNPGIALPAVSFFVVNFKYAKK